MATFLVNQHDQHVRDMEEAAALENWEALEYHCAQYFLTEEMLRERAKLARRYAYSKACYKMPKLEHRIFARILASDRDDDYINFLTLNKEAFEYVVRKALPHLHPNRPSTLEPGRAPKRARGAPSWALTCEGVMALALRWLSTRHRHKDLQLEFSCSQGAISIAIKEGLKAIVAGLKDDDFAKVIFPDRMERDGLVELVQQQYGTSPYPLRFFACADGTLLLSKRPPTEEVQLKMYSGKDRVHAWNNIFVVSPTGKIIAKSTLWAGSFNDSTVSERLFRHIRDITDDDEHVAVDGGFPRDKRYIQPLQTGDVLPADPVLKSKELRTSKYVTVVRQVSLLDCCSAIVLFSL